jgi:predicted metal-dependent hydrolase
MIDIFSDIKCFLGELKRDLPEIFSDRTHYDKPAEKTEEFKGCTLLLDFKTGRKKAGDIICARVRHWSSVMKLEHGRVLIKDQKTLWASCSVKKNLNFNWRLAAAPAGILDYVVIHELCHIREMNHSKKFWRLVAELCPDYAERRKLLRHYSKELRKNR